KTALSLKHELLPPMVHFEKPNPNIDFEDSPFFVNSKLTPWNHGTLPRRAGVSAFGLGGTNAHVVLEAAPSVESSVSPRRAHLLLLSAKSEAALNSATRNFALHFKSNPQTNLADAAYTLQAGRHAFSHRRAM